MHQEVKKKDNTNSNENFSIFCGRFDYLIFLCNNKRIHIEKIMMNTCPNKNN